MAGISTHVPNPYVHLGASPGVPISRADALASIQNYLEASKTAPHLHPDAHFEESGITFGPSASAGGVILHQLRRVEQGLQGVWLGIDPEAVNADATNVKINTTELDSMLDSELSADYQKQLREQGEGDVTGEVDIRNNAVGNVDQPEPIIATKGPKRLHSELDSATETPTKDKEARKKAKKERQSSVKKERREQRETPKKNTNKNENETSSQANGESQVDVNAVETAPGDPTVQFESSQTAQDSQSPISHKQASQLTDLTTLSPTPTTTPAPNSNANVDDSEVSNKTGSRRASASDYYTPEPAPMSPPKSNGHVEPTLPDADTNADATMVDLAEKDDKADEGGNKDKDEKARRKAEKKARREEKKRMKAGEKGAGGD